MIICKVCGDTQGPWIYVRKEKEFQCERCYKALKEKKNEKRSNKNK